MKKVKYRANATEVNKTPREVRYVWVITTNNGMVSTCATFQTLDKIKVEEVKSIIVVDLCLLELVKIAPSALPELKQEWRDNYFNHSWDISHQYQVQ
jgi:hypothetical protein